MRWTPSTRGIGTSWSSSRGLPRCPKAATTWSSGPAASPSGSAPRERSRLSTASGRRTAPRSATTLRSPRTGRRRTRLTACSFRLARRGGPPVRATRRSTSRSSTGSIRASWARWSSPTPSGTRWAAARRWGCPPRSRARTSSGSRCRPPSRRSSSRRSSRRRTRTGFPRRLSSRRIDRLRGIRVTKSGGSMRSSHWFRGVAPLVLVFVWTSSACARQSAQVDAGTSQAVEEAASTITSEDMGARIATIADDSMGGRDTPSPGLDKTAQWIADQYSAFGLAPAGDDGTFFQRYAFPLRALDTTGVHFGSVVDGENVMLTYGEDYFVAAATPFDDRAMGHGSLVWVGRSADGPWPAVESARGHVMVVSLPGAYDRDWRIAAGQALRTAQDAG